MARKYRWIPALTATWLACHSIASAQSHILLLDKSSVAADQVVTCSLRFGRPFAHQMLPVQRPTHAAVRLPDGTSADLLPKLDRVENNTPDGASITSFEWKYTPTQRGDYTFIVRTAPIWIAEQNIFVEDTVKVTLHVQDQIDWDVPAGMPLELVPLTRPYGLRAGFTFQAMVVSGRDAAPLPRTLVEIERFNSAPPKELPPVEHMVRTVRTDPAGVATATLPESGWWGLTAVTDGGERERAGRNYPVKRRSTFWIYVDDKVPLTPIKPM